MKRRTDRSIEERQLQRQQQTEYRRRSHGHTDKPQGARIVDLDGNYPDMFWIKP